MTNTGGRAAVRVSARAVAGAVLTAGCVAGMMAVASPAAAHVTANPVGEASPGGYARVDFRAPTESDTAATTGLEVHFPEEAPIASVSTAPLPGWSAEVSYRTLDTPIEGGHGEQITEVVESVTWTVDDSEAGIQPGQFGEFGVSMGPLPEVEMLHFPAVQTYSDDTQVRWIDVAEEGVEADNPAPALELAATDDGDDGAGAQEDEPGAADDPAAAADADASSSEAGSGAAGWLVAIAVVGLVAGLAALVLGGLAFTRTRR